MLIKKKRKTIRLTLPALHPEQSEFVNDQHRVVVAACGSKTGKTFGLCIWLLRHAWNNRGTLNWWCAPTIRQATNAFNIIGRWLPKGRYHSNRQERIYWLLKDDGSVHSTIEFRSADRPESLRGDGVHAAVADEACYWNKQSYVSLWTTMTQTMGLLRVISTPKGKNWFYEEWLKGWDGDHMEGPDLKLRSEHPFIKSYRLPTWSNPFIKPEAIETLRKIFTINQFQQEIEARFLDDAAGAFKNLRECQRSRLLSKPIRGQRYILAVDWAKHEDYTTFVVVDETSKEVVHLERHNDVDWNINISRAIRCAKEWNQASMIVDSTGIGDVIFDQIKSAYPYLYGFNMGTNSGKVQLIQRLQLSFERTEILIPNPSEQTRGDFVEAAEQLLHELRMYAVDTSQFGRLIFSAPDGYHDDYVVALALANWLVNQEPFVYKASSQSV